MYDFWLIEFYFILKMHFNGVYMCNIVLLMIHYDGYVQVDMAWKWIGFFIIFIMDR